MKIITNYEELIGKTIAFAHMAQFADQITLATTSGEVLMAEMYSEDDTTREINVFQERQVVEVIQRHKYLQEKLNELGIFNLAEYQLQVEEEREEREKRLKKAREESERKEYERLKAKFEGC